MDSANFEIGIKGVTVEEDDDGTLHIEGIASDFETDRDMEAFAPGAFEAGLKAFLSNPVLLYHHKPDHQLGIVTEAVLDGKSLRIKADIPRPPEGSWATHPYSLVKRGMMRGLSVGGAFLKSGRKIVQADLQEISVTPLPVNPRTLFAVAGKAFDAESAPAELADALDRLDRVFEGVSQAGPHS